jgi:hypothetical protein
MSDHLTLLIVKADFAPHVQVAEYSNFDALMNTHILNAQLYDVRPILGDSFYADMVLNIADANYVALLDGGEYNYNSKTYFFQGLKKAIVHYSYSRYALRGGVQDTASGLVQKKNDWSEPLDYKGLSKESEYNKSIAVTVMNEVLLYLSRNQSLYPEYVNGNCEKTNVQPSGSARITSISNY